MQLAFRGGQYDRASLAPTRLETGPSRLTRRVATALARCSSATDSSPVDHATPISSRAPPIRPTMAISGAVPDERDRSTSSQAPASSPAMRRFSSCDRARLSPEPRGAAPVPALDRASRSGT